MEKYIVKTTYERIRPMDDVLLPHRSLVALGAKRKPNILSLIIVVLMFSLSIASAESSGTISYFTDAEQSVGNYFVADPIFFSVEASTTARTFIVPEVNTTTPITLTTVPGEGSDPVQYYVRAEEIGGSDAFCNALTVTSDAPLTFNGPLLALNTGTTSSMGAWNLSVSLPSATGLNDGDTCTVDLIYKGWNDGVPEGSGYTDTHRVSLVFNYQSPPVVQESAAPTSPLPPLGATEGTAEAAQGTAPLETSMTTEDATTTDAISTDPVQPVPEVLTPDPPA